MTIKMLTGVVEVGLFCGMAKAAYFGNDVSQLLLQAAFCFNDVFLRTGRLPSSGTTEKWNR